MWSAQPIFDNASKKQQSNRVSFFASLLWRAALLRPIKKNGCSKSFEEPYFPNVLSSKGEPLQPVFIKTIVVIDQYFVWELYRKNKLVVEKLDMHNMRIYRYTCPVDSVHTQHGPPCTCPMSWLTSGLHSYTQNTRRNEYGTIS